MSNTLRKHSIRAAGYKAVLAAFLLTGGTASAAPVAVTLCAKAGTSVSPAVPVWGYVKGDCASATAPTAPGGPVIDVNVGDVSDDLGMIAIQGPNALEITNTLTDSPLANLKPFSCMRGVVAGIPVLAARTGYTGEDGFEFYVSQESTAALWDALMAAGEPFGLAPIGLGARDTLRLEARMPLYGNELADDISPLEAGVGWAVKLDKGDFIGRDAIARMKEDGVPRKTVGFRLMERAGSARHGYEVQVDGREVGVVTSGGRLSRKKTHSVAVLSSGAKR